MKWEAIPFHTHLDTNIAREEFAAAPSTSIYMHTHTQTDRDTHQQYLREGFTAAQVEHTHTHTYTSHEQYLREEFAAAPVEHKHTGLLRSAAVNTQSIK